MPKSESTVSMRGKGKKILLAAIGSRGDVQPILALACELQAQGHHPLLCIPPNFQSWVATYDIKSIAIGPALHKATKPNSQITTRRQAPSPSQISQLLQASVIEQFQVINDVIKNFDLVIAAGSLLHAAKSITELHDIPYLHVSYCPVTFNSADHPPPTHERGRRMQNLPRWVNHLLWRSSDRRWNSIFRDVLNEQRAKLGLSPIRDVPSHIMTDEPLLAADPVFAPIPITKSMNVVQTGSWFLKDRSPLPIELEDFLGSGDAPVCFGFGSMRVSKTLSITLIEAARRMGLRAIISRGWGELNKVDSRADCLTIGDVNYEKLLPRVACIVHHGGAGTTISAARAGIPQIVLPHIYDQFYWANRIDQLGVGMSGGRVSHLTTRKMVSVLKICLAPKIIERAKELSSEIDLGGVDLTVAKLSRI